MEKTETPRAEDVRVFNAADFMHWLESKAPDEQVGYGCMLGECPVVEWLNETRPQQHPWWVGGVTMGYDSKHYWEHPYWVRVFTRHLDERFFRSPVNAQEAKETLLEVLG